MAVDDHTLGSVCEERLNPSNDFLTELLEESLVWDFVESLCKVKDCNVDLRSPVEDGG